MSYRYGGNIEKIEMRLGRMNFLPKEVNRKKAKNHQILLLLTTTLYGLFILAILHTLWYHLLIVLLGSFVFGYIIEDWYFGFLFRKHLIEVNEMIEAFTRCYEASHGNLVSAIRSTRKRTSEAMSRFLDLLEEALGDELYEEAGIRLKSVTKESFANGVVDIAILLKKKGRILGGKGEDLFLKALIEMSSASGQGIVSWERNELENKTTEVWILLAPIVIFPGTWLLYLLLFQKYFDILAAYRSFEAQSIAATTFLMSSIGALLVNWVRKSDWSGV